MITGSALSGPRRQAGTALQPLTWIKQEWRKRPRLNDSPLGRNRREDVFERRNYQGSWRPWNVEGAPQDGDRHRQDGCERNGCRKRQRLCIRTVVIRVASRRRGQKPRRVQGSAEAACRVSQGRGSRAATRPARK